jgi:prepilin-type processing-associated H-X9-DG protein
MSESIPNAEVAQPWSRRKAILLGAIAAVLMIGTIFCLSLISGCREHMKYDCGLQFRHIGVGCRMYAEKHDGRLPSKWSDLSEVEDGPPWHKMLRCPMSGHEAGIEAQVDLWADYRLIPGRSTNDPPHEILAIELLSNHKLGANVLFVDGSSTWLTREQVLGTAPMPKWVSE